MTKQYTEQVFRTTYKDDYTDSDNYYRVLFNSGRALQARELTQMQTIIQAEIARFGGNIFKEGATVQGGAMVINGNYEYVKIEGDNSVFDDVTALEGVIFTGATSGSKVRVFEAIAAEGSDPHTLFVQYLDNDGSVVDTPKRLAAGETITTTGGDITLQVQILESDSNKPVGQGTRFDIDGGSFFVSGHFVFAPKQSIILSKYTTNFYGEVGFKIVQDIVTSSDNDALFDNQGATPNRSSPGADRYRIRLQLANRALVYGNENYVTLATIENGAIVTRPSSQENYNKIYDFMALRTYEESGDYIKRYFKAHFEPNTSTDMMLKVGPGTAYIRGYRINKDAITTLIVPKAQDTLSINGDQIAVDYGNYFEFDSGKGMIDFSTCSLVNLKTGFNNTGDTIGTARVRAIKEGAGSKYNIYLFDIKNTSTNYILNQTRSIVADTNNLVNLVTNADGKVDLKEPKASTLLFDMPIRRPKTLSDITITIAKFQEFTASGTSKTISPGANEDIVNEGDVIVSQVSPTPLFNDATVTVNVTGGNLELTTLVSGRTYRVLYYSRLTGQTPGTKTKTSATLTAGTLDSDGNGFKYISLGKSDIFSVSKIRQDSADGPNLFQNFIVDTGSRDTHHEDGKLVYRGFGLDSENAPVYCEFEYFTRAGLFFAANSYQNVDYIDIPAYTLDNNSTVSLRDVLDFRPSTDGSGSFAGAGALVPGLPQPTDTVVADAEYYLPRNDKLILSKDGELRYLTGTSSLQPKFPTTPNDCIDLYKYQLNANTLHTKDLKSTLIPLKGYTMADINKLEKRIDKVEELTTLSLLELATNSLKVLDSAGNDRTKSGFLVDNFSNHYYTDTKSVEHRASLDPRSKLIRPLFVEESIDLAYDSDDSKQLRTVLKGDKVMLDYSEKPYIVQGQASQTINVNPFFIEKNLGHIELSPASDFWKESEKAAPVVLDGGTELDTRQALLWNNWEWNWNGVDVNELEVGAASSNVTGTSTTTTKGSTTTRLTGTNVTSDVGDWVTTGTSSATNTLSSQTVIVARETEDLWWDGDIRWGAALVGSNRNSGGRILDTVQTVTSERRDEVETVNTTTLAQTTTVTTENEYTTSTEYVTNTNTTTTVNRVASESTVREMVGSRIIDVAVIPWMRSRTISFRATGLKPNTRYFPFFDQTDVSNFVKSEDWQTFAYRQQNLVNEVWKATGLAELDSSTLPPLLAAFEGQAEVTTQHSQTYSALVADDVGQIEGTFEIPNNSAQRFATGRREFALLDISAYDPENALSAASAIYHAEGTLETWQDTVRDTRVLQIVGSQATTTSSKTRVQNTISTEKLVDTSIAEDVKVETTRSTVVGPRTTTSEVVESDPIVVTVPTPDPAPRVSAVLPSGGSFQNAFQFGTGRFRDPVAQTFSVDDQNGVFITKVRVFFKTKDTEGLPIHCELRPNLQGAPSSSHIIARTTLSAADVNIVPEDTIESMQDNGTDFIFDEPVYLSGQAGYSVVLRSDSMLYKVYISETEQFVLGSTERRVAKQPYLGSLFVSQNSQIWEPSQKQDLAMTLYRCHFETSGNAILENSVAPPRNLQRNPLVVESGSSIVTVVCRGHGLRPNDKVRIGGLVQDYADFGISLSSIRGVHTVVAVDGTAFTIDCGDTATKSGRFGGGRVVTFPNVMFDTIRPQIQNLQPETTNITFAAKFTKNSSLVDPNSTSRYNRDSKFSIISNFKNNYLDVPHAMFNIWNERNYNSGRKSARIQCTLTTTDPLVSPVIDMQRAGMICVGNLIDNQAESATSGYNVPIKYADETDPVFGTSLAKHLTTPVTLDESATGLKILLAANRPPEATFEVYYRVVDGSKVLQAQNWVLATSENSPPPDTNKNSFREYRYLIGGQNGALDPFISFQVKIVMKSTNQAKVPVFRDLRVIALAV